MRLAWMLGLLAVGLIACSCGGGGGGGSPSPAAPADRGAPAGSVLYGTDAGIVERDIAGGDVRVLVAPAQRETLSDPAISPDGELLAYTSASAPRPVGGVLDVSSEVRIANVDGAESRTLYERSVPGETALSPRWLNDTTILFVLRSFIDPANALRGSKYRLVRIDTQTGTLTPVADGAFQFDISPDRTRIAYLKGESPEEQALYVANQDGREAQRRLDTESSGLGGFGAVAFSSDGASIFLTAHGEQAARSRTTFVTLKALTHGAPVDLYNLPIDEGNPVLVAPLQVLAGNIVVAGDTYVYVTAEKLVQVDTTTGTFTELEDFVGPFRGLSYAE